MFARNFWPLPRWCYGKFHRQCVDAVSTQEQYARGSHQPVTSNVQSNTANTNHNLKTSIGETTDFDARRGARVVGRRNGVVLQWGTGWSHDEDKRKGKRICGWAFRWWGGRWGNDANEKAAVKLRRLSSLCEIDLRHSCNFHFFCGVQLPLLLYIIQDQQHSSFAEFQTLPAFITMLVWWRISRNCGSCSNPCTICIYIYELYMHDYVWLDYFFFFKKK